MGKVTALKATNLAKEHNLNIRGTEGIHPCESQSQPQSKQYYLVYVSIHHQGRCAEDYYEFTFQQSSQLR